MIINISVTIADDASRVDLCAAMLEAGRMAGNCLELHGTPEVDELSTLSSMLLPTSVERVELFRSE